MNTSNMCISTPIHRANILKDSPIKFVSLFLDKNLIFLTTQLTILFSKVAHQLFYTYGAVLCFLF